MIRRKPFAERSAYARRPRDTGRMLWVKTLPCFAATATALVDQVAVLGIANACMQFRDRRVVVAMLAEIETLRRLRPAICSRIVEADHMGARGLGRKADDTTCAPLCSTHHRHRTDFAGAFRDFDREAMRRFCDVAITWTHHAWAAAQPSTDPDTDLPF